MTPTIVPSSLTSRVIRTCSSSSTLGLLNNSVLKIANVSTPWTQTDESELQLELVKGHFSVLDKYIKDGVVRSLETRLDALKRGGAKSRKRRSKKKSKRTSHKHTRKSRRNTKSKHKYSKRTTRKHKK